MGHSHADWESAYAAGDLRKDRFVTLSFADVPALGVPEAGEPPERIGYPGSYPVYKRRSCHRLSGAAVDDAPVRRIRLRCRHE